jgi:hypothetical protein
LAARLRGLEPSLSVEFPAGGQGDPRIGALIGHVRKSLTLRPPARDALDWEFLAAVRKETAEESEVARPSATLPWPEAFRRFQEGFPQIARLVPDFLRAAAAIPWELYRGQEAGSQNRQTKTEGPSAADSPAQSDRKAPARADLPQQSSAPPAPAAGESAQRAPSGSESGSWGVGQWLLVLLAIFLARAACTGISHRPPPRIELPPGPAPWTGPSRDDGKWLQETTRRLLEEHRKKMEKARPFVPEGPPPGPAAVPEVKTPGAAPGPAPSAPRR